MAWAGDDVSVVIQGPVHGAPNDPPERQLTREAIASARRAWPGCQVIVSTWSNADVSNLQPDRMVLNLDPGAVPLNDSPNNRLFNNLNRQIVSTRAGLAVAERSWAIKLRSDCALECPADFASLVLPVGASPWKLFDDRVVILSTFTRNPLRRPLLYHASDLFQAGRRQDLVAIWSAALVEEPHFTRWLQPGRMPAINALTSEYLFRCAPEQYLVEQLMVTRKLAAQLNHSTDGTVVLLFRWLNILAENFTILTPTEAGVRIPPRMAEQAGDPDLVQPRDRAWLDRWPREPGWSRLRVAAALYYLSARLAYGPPSLWSRSAGKLLRAVADFCDDAVALTFHER